MTVPFVMSTGRKRTLYALAGLTALLVAAIVYVATRPACGRLLDGTRVTLQKVTYGTNHTAPAAPIEGLLRHLPSKWIGGLGWNPSFGQRRDSCESIFVFWLKLSTPAGATQSVGYAFVDENGFEFPMVFTGPYGSYSPGGFSKNNIGLVRGSSIFPHRSKEFFLRLYQQNANGERIRVAEFPIKNHGARTLHVWAPQALPIEQQTNGLVCSLVKAEVGIAPPRAVLAPYYLQAGDWSEFRFRVSRQGQPASGWSINEIWILDDAGRRLRISAEDNGAFNHEFSRREGDEIICLHRWEFSSEDPAWKLSVHFELSGDPGLWVEYFVRPRFLRGSTALHRPLDSDHRKTQP